MRACDCDPLAQNHVVVRHYRDRQDCCFVWLRVRDIWLLPPASPVSLHSPDCLRRIQVCLAALFCLWLIDGMRADCRNLIGAARLTVFREADTAKRAFINPDSMRRIGAFTH